MNLRALYWVIFYFLISCTFYVALSLKAWNWYARKANTPCQTPVNEMQDLKELIVDCHTVLEKFKLTHILIAGSLFGAMRVKDVLPWDNDVDIALLSDEIVNIDEELLFKEFNKLGIDIYYRTWFGTYRITRGTARGDLMVFKEAWLGVDMARTGIESWVFYVNHFHYHRFPARFFKKPLPTLKFVGKNMSVPREGMEIQKLMYPNDWWQVVKPIGCT